MTTRKQALNEIADVFEKHGVSLDVERKLHGEFDLDLLIKGGYDMTLLDECLGRELTPKVLRDLANQQEERDGE